jgi:PKD repeat protein
MNKNKLRILSLFIFFAAFTATAQLDEHNMRDGESVEYCLHHKKMEALRQNPAFLQQFLQEQEQLRQIENQLAQDTSPVRVVYKIPVVFHVLHNGGIENISNAQILDALEVLNRDYRRLNTDANNVVFDFNASNPNAVCTPADIEVEFVLATKAPNGTCFSGITRTQSSQSYSDNGDAQVNAIINGNDVYNGEWAGNKYLNIFICGEIGGAAGYTFTPSGWSGTGMDNGIWILHDYVGRIGTGGVGTDRALTHEVGHWLNLEHTWGPNNDPGDPASCSTDDGVADTPNTIGVTACLLNEASCGPRANVENYMDYSYCSKMFSGGQKNRMRAALNSSTGGRNNLWTASNLTLTGADGDTYLCAADFYSDRVKICAGSTVEFFDNSYNNVSSWNWTFQGAETTTSTEQNPVVQYNTPGVYSVTLVAGDGNTTMTKTMNAYITVTGAGVELPFLDGFETYSTLASSGYWEIDNQQNNSTFQISTTAAHTGSKSVKLPNYGQTGTNVDELIANPVDLSDVTSSANVTLSFRFSYRKRAAANAEKLYVLFSGNCGESWEIRKSLQGSALGSTVLSTSWTPSLPEHWTTVHMTNITSQYWNQNFRYKFRFEGSGGNNLYLDNINIYPGGPSDALVGEPVNDISELEPAQQINLFPNPADGELNISYVVTGNKATTVQIVDLLGKVISGHKINSMTGENLVVISTENLAPGLYNAQITVDGKSYVKQFMVK